MHKRMMTVVGVIALVALLGVVAISVASAEGPWWMQEDGDFQPPWMNDDFECLEDCPYDGEPQHRNFVDEDDDGINDNAPRAGGRWNSDQDYESFGRHAGRGHWSQDTGEFQMPCLTNSDFRPGMMGRWGQNDGTAGPGAGMGRRSQ
jgi:hypothetical protein